MPYLSAKQKIKIGEISLVVKQTMSYALSSPKQMLELSSSLGKEASQ
jgi:hypothetical protein